MVRALRVKLTGLLPALVVAAAIATACGDGTAPAPSATGAGPGIPEESVPQTGVAVVDRALAAVVSGDTEDLAKMLRFQTVPCVAQLDPLSQQNPQPPLCPPGSPSGTMVEAFLHGTCEGAWARQDEAPDILEQRLASANLMAYAVHRMASISPQALPAPADYIVTFGVPGSPAEVFGLQAGIRDDGLGWLMMGCDPIATQTARLREAGAEVVPFLTAKSREGDHGTP